MEPASRPNRTVPTRDAFVRRLRSLNTAALARFVADLHAARGHETEIPDADDATSADCERVVVRIPRGEHDEVRTLAVRTFPPSGTFDADAVVVGRAVDDERLGDGTSIVDAAALHRMTLYAIDRDQLPALLRRHFGANAFADGDDSTARQRFPIPLDGRHLAFAAVLVLVVAAAAAGVGPLARWGTSDAVGGGDAASDGDADDDRDGAGGGDGRAAGAIRVTAAPGSSGTTPESPTVGVSGPPGVGTAVCPSPPTNVHPVVFRPVPANTASAFGLDGWRLRRAENVTVGPGRTERQTPYVPEVRHKAIYEAPSGAVYVLVADRWSSPALAAEVARVFSYPRQVAFAWGPYTFAVTASAPAGERLSNASLRSGATELLAHMRSPTGTAFGEKCVRRLSAAQNATDDSTDTFSMVARDFNV